MLFCRKYGCLTLISNISTLYLVHFDCTIIIIIVLHLITIASITSLFTCCNFVLVMTWKRIVWKHSYFEIISTFKTSYWFFLNTIKKQYTHLTTTVLNFTKSKITLQKYVQIIRYYRKYVHRETTNGLPNTYSYKGYVFSVNIF